jgi:hypothetical protein
MAMGSKLGYYGHEHEMLDFDRTILENMLFCQIRFTVNPEARNVLGLISLIGDDVT